MDNMDQTVGTPPSNPLKEKEGFTTDIQPWDDYNTILVKLVNYATHLATFTMEPYTLKQMVTSTFLLGKAGAYLERFINGAFTASMTIDENEHEFCKQILEGFKMATVLSELYALSRTNVEDDIFQLPKIQHIISQLEDPELELATILTAFLKDFTIKNCTVQGRILLELLMIACTFSVFKVPLDIAYLEYAWRYVMTFLYDTNEQKGMHMANIMRVSVFIINRIKKDVTINAVFEQAFPEPEVTFWMAK